MGDSIEKIVIGEKNAFNLDIAAVVDDWIHTALIPEKAKALDKVLKDAPDIYREMTKLGVFAGIQYGLNHRDELLEGNKDETDTPDDIRSR
jgi:hypothetical protein